MNQSHATASQGLMLVFIGQIVSLFTFIPVLGVFAALGGLIVSVIGFYTLSQVNEGYKNAFMLTIVNLVISVLKVFFKTGIFSTMLGLIGSILGLLVVYLLCNTTAELLKGTDDGLVDRAGLIWKLYALCTIVSIVCSLLSYIPLINILAALFTFVIAIVQIVASVLYMIFLWKSQNALKG